eukprot:UC1_evm1s1174
MPDSYCNEANVCQACVGCVDGMTFNGNACPKKCQAFFTTTTTSTTTTQVPQEGDACIGGTFESCGSDPMLSCVVTSGLLGGSGVCTKVTTTSTTTTQGPQEGDGCTGGIFNACGSDPMLECVVTSGLPGGS